MSKANNSRAAKKRRPYFPLYCFMHWPLVKLLKKLQTAPTCPRSVQFSGHMAPNVIATFPTENKLNERHLSSTCVVRVRHVLDTCTFPWGKCLLLPVNITYTIIKREHPMWCRQFWSRLTIPVVSQIVQLKAKISQILQFILKQL